MIPSRVESGGCDTAHFGSYCLQRPCGVVFRREHRAIEPKLNGDTVTVERASGTSSVGRYSSSHLSHCPRPHQTSLPAPALAPVHVRAARGPLRMAQKKSCRPFSPLYPRQPPSPPVPMQPSASGTWGYVSCAVAPLSGATACRASSIRGRSGGLQSEPSARAPSAHVYHETKGRGCTLSLSDARSSCLISFSRASRMAYRVTARSASSIR